MKPKLIRITTVPQSLKTLLKGQLRFMSENGFVVVIKNHFFSEFYTINRFYFDYLNIFYYFRLVF
jgi:hypothetical protein